MWPFIWKRLHKEESIIDICALRNASICSAAFLRKAWKRSSICFGAGFCHVFCTTRHSVLLPRTIFSHVVPLWILTGADNCFFVLFLLTVDVMYPSAGAGGVCRARSSRCWKHFVRYFGNHSLAKLGTGNGRGCQFAIQNYNSIFTGRCACELQRIETHCQFFAVSSRKRNYNTKNSQTFFSAWNMRWEIASILLRIWCHQNQ